MAGKWSYLNGNVEGKDLKFRKRFRRWLREDIGLILICLVIAVLFTLAGWYYESIGVVYPL